MVAVEADDTEIARRLTMAGLEVETLERLGDDLSGVRVAEVRGSVPHPQSDRLTVVDVDDGRGTCLVVCGAPNVPAPGGRVALATPGTTLPGGLGVQARAVRGVESAGMLCSEAELAIGDDASGLLILPDDVRVGAPIAEALRLRDTVLDLGVAPNRPDCMGHVGVARELAALFGAKLVLPAADVAPLESGPPARDFVSVEVQDAERCPRYVARLVWDVQVRPSPFWLRWRLRILGVRSLGNVVDVTNLVLLESGHPLHAFDLDRVLGSRIVVRRAKPGEIIVTLDGTARELSPDDLLIADPDRPLAVAGIMGGADSEVRAQTRRIALEAAAFEPRGIRRTSRRLGLRSESSTRFERGCDVEGLDWASRHAAKLITELGGGRLVSGSVDARSARPHRREIRLRPGRCRSLLGVELGAPEMTSTLELLGMQVRPDGDGMEGALRVGIPSHRVDLVREADLAEEIVRIRGLDGVPATLPAAAAAPGRSGDPVADTVRDTLCASGLHETVSLAFSGPHALAAPGDPRPVAIRNPLREDCANLRTWLLPGLLAALRKNHERGVEDVALFEVGRVFSAGADRALPEEFPHAAAVLSGSRPAWLRSGAGVDFFDVKGFLEELSSNLRIRFEFSTSTHAFLHPGAQAEVRIAGGAAIGWAGKLHPTCCRNEMLPPGVAFELDLGTLSPPEAPRMRALPRYPAVVRDLSFFIAASAPWARIRAALMPDGESILEAVRILEDYRDPDRVPPGQKGIFLTLRYRASDRTLTDDEVNATHERLVAGLAARLPITRR